MAFCFIKWVTIHLSSLFILMLKFSIWPVGVPLSWLLHSSDMLCPHHSLSTSKHKKTVQVYLFLSCESNISPNSSGSFKWRMVFRSAHWIY